MRERTPGPVALHGWALLLHSATQKFINEAGSDRISYVDMDRLAKSMTERAMHTETSLLDMDMVKGSSMRKRWVDRRLNSIATQRIILMPLHSRYWAGQLGWGIAAPLALLWVMYASLLYSRSVRSTIWIPGWAQHLNLWSVGKGADMELFSPAAMLIILGLTYGAYAVETHVTDAPTKRGADGDATQGSKKHKLGRDKSSTSLINETDTDSSASDSSDGSDSDDEVAGLASSPTEDATTIRSRIGTGAREVVSSTTVESNGNGGPTSLSAKRLLTEPSVQNASGRQDGSPPGVGRASISSRGAIRATIWEQATEEERNMPFVVGERAGSKRYMDLQDIGRIISTRVREQRPNTRYLRAAAACTVIIVLGPLLHRLQSEIQQIWGELSVLGLESWYAQLAVILRQHLDPVATSTICATVVCLAAKAVCTAGVLLHLAVIERCESQRCLRAKYFAALTSRGKSRRFGVPHLRLHTVENVRMWLALRSHLRHHGPQRASIAIVSRCCTATLLLTLITTVRFLEWSGAVKTQHHTHPYTPTTEFAAAAAAAATAAADVVTNENGSNQRQEIVQLLTSCIKTSAHTAILGDKDRMVKQMHGPGTHAFLQGSALNFDLVVWTCVLGFFSLRFIQISLYLNNKYKANVALLLSEQMHCHIRAQHKPHKRTELLCTIQVLKVGTKLLKELEGPHKISGLPMSPLYSSLFKLIVLSALSAVGSQMLGLNLRLWKINVL